MTGSNQKTAKSGFLWRSRLPLPAIAMLLLCGSASQFHGQEVSGRPVARLIVTNSGERSRIALLAPLPDSEPKIPNASIEEPNRIERSAFDRTNDHRVRVGLPRLEWDAALCRMARHHSEAMARAGYFSHETPEGLRLKDRAREAGIAQFRLIAENIAYNQGLEDPGAFAVERWMLSIGHRVNILYRGFQTVAVGSYVSPDGRVFLTQIFIER